MSSIHSTKILNTTNSKNPTCAASHIKTHDNSKSIIIRNSHGTAGSSLIVSPMGTRIYIATIDRKQFVLYKRRANLRINTLLRPYNIL